MKQFLPSYEQIEELKSQVIQVVSESTVLPDEGSFVSDTYVIGSSFLSLNWVLHVGGAWVTTTIEYMNLNGEVIESEELGVTNQSNFSVSKHPLISPRFRIKLENAHTSVRHIRDFVLRASNLPVEQVIENHKYYDDSITVNSGETSSITISEPQHKYLRLYIASVTTLNALFENKLVIRIRFGDASNTVWVDKGQIKKTGGTSQHIAGAYDIEVIRPESSVSIDFIHMGSGDPITINSSVYGMNIAPPPKKEKIHLIERRVITLPANEEYSFYSASNIRAIPIENYLFTFMHIRTIPTSSASLTVKHNYFHNQRRTSGIHAIFNKDTEFFTGVNVMTEWREVIGIGYTPIFENTSEVEITLEVDIYGVG